ncbi:hypothetical protein SUNI508_11758 [Seiridium unicorne]|uniref:Aminotransferase class I/classII large domain-containing protein n=1 Tax=Seiridium unicorne TaxID=138068 RepID=A0ABR2UGD3_9PEZI
MISLGTARPAPQYYPWEGMTMQCFNNKLVQSNGHSTSSSMSCVKGEEEYDLDIAMNYGFSAGSPQTLRYITEHVEMVHNPPYEDWESCLTCGTTSALEIALRVFCNLGDTVLVENYTYTGTISSIHAQGLNALGVEMDQYGLSPTDLNEKLENWDLSKGPKPFVLYTIPTGQNPTGITQSIERRREIYEVAVRHDLYIFEDDPYYFLQMTGPEGYASGTAGLAADDYLAQLPPSYLSLDQCGRVLRMDSTSKILAPGLRCGWITACAQIMEKFASAAEVGVLAPSGPSQVMLYKLLDQTWGHTGFVEWLSTLAHQYLVRRDTLVKACVKSLPLDICRWEVPSAGMFLWISVDVTKHPAFVRNTNGNGAGDLVLDIEDGVFRRSQENGVLISKGSWFSVDHNSAQEVFFRLTFAAAPEELLNQGIEGFAKAVCSEFKE